MNKKIAYVSKIRRPLTSTVIFLATDTFTGKQYIKTYPLTEIIMMEGYYHIIGDMTGSNDRSKFVLRVLPNQTKLPFYVYDPYENEITLHDSAAVFADDNRLSRNSVSKVLNKEWEQIMGWRMWYVGDTPPAYMIKGVEKGGEVHKADTWAELAVKIDVSKQALSNGYREGRRVMGWDVFYETRDLAKMAACFEVSQEFQESVDIIQNPCYDKEVENEESN
ncbi:HNH homing endonuclease [Bacillus phage MrBubbles]|nr:HNH homing endonuclease [Bacillus phage MrBubbles]